MTTLRKNTNNQIVSAKGLRRAARRAAIVEASASFVKGTWDALFNKIGKPGKK